MRKGFTLVELSIVLVIIGLLAGGILVGKSMIGTTRVQSFVKQIGQFDAGLSSFQLKYNSWPGDTKQLDTSNMADGDGIIEDARGVQAESIAFSGENTYFWEHMTVSGFDPAHKYTHTIDPTSGKFNGNPKAPNAPVSALGEKGNITICSYVTEDIFNYYLVSNSSNLTNADRSIYPPPTYGTYAGDINAVKYSDAKAIDLKMDDGDLRELDNYPPVMLTKQTIFAIYYPTNGSSNRDCLPTDDKCILYIKSLATLGFRK